MLEVAERLTDKQPGDTRFTQVQAPGGKTLLLLVCSLITAEPKVTGVRRCNLADVVSYRQCPLLWTWVLEKMGMLEVAERLTDKQPGDTRFTQVQAPGGKTLLLLVCSLITAEPKVTGVRRCNLAWRCVCESMKSSRSVDLLWSSLSGVQIVDLSIGGYGVCRSCPPRWTLLDFIYGEASVGDMP